MTLDVSPIKSFKASAQTLLSPLSYTSFSSYYEEIIIDFTRQRSKAMLRLVILRRNFSSSSSSSFP